MNELDERSKKILWAIIQSYISCEGPVGSRTVMKRYPIGLSSSTIRNTMADLEGLGYVAQPHTSAGRIPTEKGYRVYVNFLLEERTSSIVNINKQLLQHLFNKLRDIEKDINKLIKETSRTLSIYSKYLGVATHPKPEGMVLRQIEFIKHRNNKILSILISEDGVVKNKVITLEDKTFTHQQLDTISRYLNSELKGLTLGEIKAKIVSQISREKIICDKLIANALALCKKAIELETENMFYSGEISGTWNLPDFASMKQIKDIFKAIEEKHFIVKLLDKLSSSEGVQVFIGSENILSEMRELSVVASVYNDGHRALGTIGIIGPTRMDYEKVIPLVALTAKTLTQIFSGR